MLATAACVLTAWRTTGPMGITSCTSLPSLASALTSVELGSSKAGSKLSQSWLPPALMTGESLDRDGAGTSLCSGRLLGGVGRDAATAAAAAAAEEEGTVAASEEVVAGVGVEVSGVGLLCGGVASTLTATGSKEIAREKTASMFRVARYDHDAVEI